MNAWKVRIRRTRRGPEKCKSTGRVGGLRMTKATRRTFETAMHEAGVHEESLRWEEALEAYTRLLKALEPHSDPESRTMSAAVLLRRGNALMELRRWDEARATFDAALHEAKRLRDRDGNGRPDLLAQAVLASGVYAANRGDHARAEAFLLDALQRFHGRDDRPSRQGRGWAFLNLATLYGKTGRLDLAFVTFTKAQDVLGAAEDWAGVAAAWEAQAQLRRAIQDEDRWREDLAEAIIFYDRAKMKDKAARLRGLLGKRLV